MNPPVFDKMSELGFLNGITDFILWTTEAFPFRNNQIKEYDELENPILKFQNVSPIYSKILSLDDKNKDHLEEFSTAPDPFLYKGNEKLKKILAFIKLISLDRSSLHLEALPKSTSFNNQDEPLPSQLFSRNVYAFKVLADLFSFEFRESTNNTRAREKIKNSVVPEIQLEILFFLQETFEQNNNCISLFRKFNMSKLLFSDIFFWNHTPSHTHPFFLNLTRFNVLNFIQSILNKKESKSIGEFKTLLVPLF